MFPGIDVLTGEKLLACPGSNHGYPFPLGVRRRPSMLVRIGRDRQAPAEVPYNAAPARANCRSGSPVMPPQVSMFCQVEHTPKPPPGFSNLAELPC